MVGAGAPATTSPLIGRTRDGRASPDAAPLHGSATTRAIGPAVPRGLQVAEVRSTTSVEVGDRGPDAAGETHDVGPIEFAGGTSGVDAAAPTHLVDEQVAETGDPSLVEKSRLERARRPGERPTEGVCTDGRSIGPESGQVGIEFDPAETPWVAHHEGAAVIEVDTEAVPLRVLPVGAVAQIVESGDPVEQQTAGHPEPQPERTAVVEVDDEQLSDASGRDCDMPHEPGDDLGRRARCHGQRIDVDRPDPTADHPLRETAIPLDLDQLGHASRSTQRPRRNASSAAPT